MSELVLFHHALGLTPGVLTIAETLRSAGHTVHTPDLYDGATFDDLGAGVDHARSIGFDVVRGRGVAAVADLPAALVYAGISLGAMPAQQLAQTRAGARGLVLIAGVGGGPDEYGPTWPDTVPVQVHAAEHDPEFDNGYDKPAAEALVAAAPAGELFLYPGDAHLFVDPTSSDHDPAAASLVTARVLALLDRV